MSYFGRELFFCLLILNSGCIHDEQNTVPMAISKIQIAREPPSDFAALLGVSDANSPNSDLLEWLDRYSEAEVKLENKIDLQARLVDISDIEFNDALLKSIAQSTTLKWLRVGERGKGSILDWVVKNKNLKGLSLRNSKLGDGDLKKLEQLNGLQWLDLCNADIGTNSLPLLPNLEVLILDTDLTDMSLPREAQFPKLRVLSLRHSNITDEGLKKLLVPSLRCLNISGAKMITADSVDFLVLLKNLELLQVGGSKLASQRYNNSVHAVEEIMNRLPGRYVEMSQ